MASQERATSGSVSIANPFRRRRSRSPQNEIQPASGSGALRSHSDASSFAVPATTIPDLIEGLRSPNRDQLHRALSNVINVTREPTEGVITELVTNGALPVLVQILARGEVDLHLRIRVAAAICNLSQAKHSLRSFYSCDAVRVLVEHVIGEHQALTGAVALMFKSMLISENLVRSMVECKAPTVLLRGLMLCTNLEISDTVVDTLIQMTTIEELKNSLVDSRAVESCLYFLHVLARSHYLTSVQKSFEFRINREDAGQPGFTYKSMRDALIWSLMQMQGTRLRTARSPHAPTPEMEFFIPPHDTMNWEAKLKNSSVIGSDREELEFTEMDMMRAALFVELLTCLVDDCPLACSRLANMQFSLDILAYWIRRGSCLTKQGGLLTTCYLLRNGHRGFVTLKDVVGAIKSILTETERSGSGVTFTKYKCVAAEAVNDLSVFGGDNVRIAIASAGILRPLLSLLEVDDYPLQHLTLRALHTVCCHPIPLAHLVDYGAIPFLCHFLASGLKEGQPRSGFAGTYKRAARGCLSRKRVATISMTQAEIDLSHREEQDYSRIRRLEYCAAVLRCIAAVQSAEWLHDFNKCRIVPITLDALVQNYSVLIRKQALGILASIITLRDSNISTNICIEGGCDLLVNLRSHSEKLGDVESAFWMAWINFVLYYLAQSHKTRRFVEQAMRQQYGDSVDLKDNNVFELLKPDQSNLDLDWIANIT